MLWFVIGVVLVAFLILLGLVLPDVVERSWRVLEPRPTPTPFPTAVSEPFPEPLPTATVVTPLDGRVCIPPGTYLTGRSDVEVEGAYQSCVEMSVRTDQVNPSPCEKKEEIFGDNMLHVVILDHAVCFDPYEYPGKGKIPQIVSPEEAEAVCKERGGRVPLGDEWEIAAIPAGIAYKENISNLCRIANIDCKGGNPQNPLMPSGSYDPTGGLYDMTGNVAEIVKQEDGTHELRGGWSGSYNDFAYPSQRLTLSSKGGGVRCVFDQK